jgi:predicted transcriptional regulator
LDDSDLKIVRALQAEGRMPVQEFAEKVGMSASPCARCLRNLEKAGIIKATIESSFAPGEVKRSHALPVKETSFRNQPKLGKAT